MICFLGRVSAPDDVDVCQTWIKVKLIHFNSKRFLNFQFRNPSKEDIVEMMTLLPDLRDKIVAAFNVKKFRGIYSFNLI